MPVEMVKLLQDVDDIATEELKKAGYKSVLSAMPLILILIHFSNTVNDIFKKIFYFEFSKKYMYLFDLVYNHCNAVCACVFVLRV